MVLNKKRIKVGISIGDVNGIGPEIILKCFSDLRMFDSCTPIVYGSNSVLLHYGNSMKINVDNLNVLNDKFEPQANKINICEIKDDLVKVQEGVQSISSGKFSFLALEKAVQDIASNKVDVLVTAPIDKFSISQSGFKFQGHTEYLANYANEEYEENGHDLKS